jgi:FMN reductase [NAD(P)H]
VELSEAVKRRRMVRRYTSDGVDPGVLRAILETASRAPSAGFAQGQRFVVLSDPTTRVAVARLAGEPDFVARGFRPWLSSAPVHVVLCADRAAYLRRYAREDKVSSSAPDEWRVRYEVLDAGAALMLLLLAAVDHGLAAGFLGSHRLVGIEELLGIPDEVLVVGLVTLGHPAPDRRSGSLDPGRVPFEERVHYDRW